jgi:hypothetical protein
VYFCVRDEGHAGACSFGQPGTIAVESALDVQIGGDHYKQFKIQPIEFIHANNIPFIEGNIIKYACRWRDKGGIETLKKIKHYVDLLIDLSEPNDDDGCPGGHV